MLNQMEHDMETGVLQGLYKCPSIHIHLDWALKSVQVTYVGLNGSLELE